MNIETNELIDFETESLREMLGELEEGEPADDLVAVAHSRAVKALDRLEGFQAIPKELEHAARCALQGRGRVKVSKQSKGKLSKWAASQKGKRLAMHPSLSAILRHFRYEHLPEVLQAVSRPFCELAHKMAEELPGGPEVTAGLRKLLEAKDCAVRAALPDDD